MEAYIDYIYILIAALACCLLPINRQKIASFLLLLTMMFMCGMRGYDVGVDTHNYVSYAEGYVTLEHSWGPIYVFLHRIASLFANSPTAFLMEMAILTYIPLIIIAIRLSDYPALSVLMYIIPVAIFFNETFNIARQSIAIVYVLIAAIMLNNQKKNIAILLIIFAFILHPYTFISILILFLDKIHLTKNKVAVLLIASTIIGLIGALPIVNEVLNILMQIVSGSSSEFILKFGTYSSEGRYVIESNFSLIGQLSHIMPLLVMCWIGANEQTLKNTYFKMMLFGCIITNILVSVIFCERFASTLTIAQFLAVPYIYKTSKASTRVLVVLLIIGTALLYIYNLREYSTLPDWTPYHTYFNEN